jgi:broad specificity phosphatase PhoE
MIKRLIVLASFTILFSCSQKQEPKTIYLVRHAEKQLIGDDPELSVAGNARAVKLGQILEDKEIVHVFSTDFIRTKATVQPLLTAQPHLELEIYNAREHDNLVKELRQRKGNAVVVGHSNTIHHVANYFVEGKEKYPELEDIEYNFIFVVNLDKDGSSSVERKTFRDFD